MSTQFSQAGAQQSNPGTLTTPNINTTSMSGNLLVCVASEETSAGTITGISDNKGNVWSALPLQVNGTHQSQVFWCRLANVGTGHTVTFTVSGTPSGSGSISYDIFSGPASGFDGANAPNTLLTFVQAVQANPGPSIPHFAANALILVTADDGGVSVAYTAGTGYTIHNGGSAGNRIGSEYQSVGPGTYPSSFGGTSGAQTWNVMVFRPANDPGNTINTIGDFLLRLATKTNAVWTIAPSTVNPGTWDLLRNGKRLWSFLWIITSGTQVDANPSGGQLTIIDAGGVECKVDAIQFVQSLS